MRTSLGIYSTKSNLLENILLFHNLEWISKGKTLIRYIGKTKKHLSFKPNEDIYIVSKPVDPGVTDWVGKVSYIDIRYIEL